MNVSVINMNTNITSLAKSVDFVIAKARSRQGSYVCVSTVHMCMEVFDSAEFRSIVNQADLIIPDGRPISWAQKLLGFSEAQQVRGQDIMNELCGISGAKQLNVGLYGGSSDDLLCLVVDKLKISYPDIRINYSYSPPFRALTHEEDEAIFQSINASGVNILFVGIGCPKQERWMAEHKSKVNCVMLGVGAAYDFIAESKKHAPKWMQKLGLEWLFRLVSEPKRLWRRYLKQNPRFIYYFLQQWLLKRKFN